MTRTQAVASAIGLFAVWTLATYLLEGRVGTFLRPDATSRFVYTVFVNVLIGIVGAALVIRAIVRRAELPRLTTYGIAEPRRILVLVPVAAVVAVLFLMGHKVVVSIFYSRIVVRGLSATHQYAAHTNQRLGS